MKRVGLALVVALAAVTVLSLLGYQSRTATKEEAYPVAQAQAQAQASRQGRDRVKPRFILPPHRPRLERVYSRPIPIDQARDIAAMSGSKDDGERTLGEAWDRAIISRLEENYEQTSECLREYSGDKKGQSREWVLYLEIVDGEIAEVWSPEWPYDFRSKEGGCFARAIEGARIDLPDERSLLKTDFGLVL